MLIFGGGGGGRVRGILIVSYLIIVNKMFGVEKKSYTHKECTGCIYKSAYISRFRKSL